MSWLSHLWAKTKKIASLYTGTFIFVMFLNQLLFFGLCLNPICLIAAMPHVLLITVFLGTLINKISNSSDAEKGPQKSSVEISKRACTKNKRNTESPLRLNKTVNTKTISEKSTKALEQRTKTLSVKTSRQLTKVDKQKTDFFLTQSSQHNRVKLAELRTKVDVKPALTTENTTSLSSKKGTLKLANKYLEDSSTQENFELLTCSPGPQKNNENTSLTQSAHHTFIEDESPSFPFSLSEELHRVNSLKKEELEGISSSVVKCRTFIKPQESSLYCEKCNIVLRRTNSKDYSILSCMACGSSFQNISSVHVSHKFDQEFKHVEAKRAKAKHQINSKYKFRESILRRKDAIECANRSAETNARAELISTTVLCRNNGIKNRNGFFKYLIEIGLIFFENKKYYLTNKGKQFGGMYRGNEKNERWIVWSNDALNNVIFNFKIPSLERVNISYLMHITHIANLPGILSKGLLPHNNKAQKVDISNGLVNARRAKKEPIYKYSVHDYVPFYFNVKNAMLFQVQKEFGAEVVILSFSKKVIASPKAIFSRGNASSLKTTFTSDINELAFFNWSKVFSSSWSQNGIIDLELKSIMMSECLVYEKVAIDKLYCIYCQNVSVQRRIKKMCEDNKMDIDVVVDSKLFF
tara:strand:+ start:1003 stop:2913 length:1911 start_codon:yes stop_codon:yes gene_type:complete